MLHDNITHISYYNIIIALKEEQHPYLYYVISDYHQYITEKRTTDTGKISKRIFVHFEYGFLSSECRTGWQDWKYMICDFEMN